MDKKISIILSTYNEAPVIVQTINEILNNVKNVEIILVDDNSPDGTLEKVKNINNPNIKIFSRKSRGLASAFLVGLINSSEDIVGWIDSNLTSAATRLPEMIDQLSNNDIILLSRYVEGGKYVKWPLTRKLISKVGNGLAGLWLGLDVKDSMTGLFALKKDLIKNLSFEAIGYKILLEILVKTKGAKVKEVPFVCVNRQEGSSKFSFSIINDYFKLLKILRKSASYNTKNR